MPRLLAVGHALRPTGYARVLDGVARELARAHEVTLFAVNHNGDAPEGKRPYALLTNRRPGDRSGRDQLPGLLRALEPDVVLLHGDTRTFASQCPALEQYRRERPAARALAYCPVDWLRLAPRAARALAAMDLVVLYSEAARAAVRRSFAEHGLDEPATDVIPHALDRDAFRPLVAGDPAGSRALARRRLFGDRPDLADAFVVLNANRNEPRKRIDLTLRGFAAMARDRPRAHLYLHMGMVERGCDVLALAAQLGIADRLLTTTREPRRAAVSDEQLNLVYNACDAGVNTAAAEGFGLVSLEHAAAGAAQVVPDHGACAELWRGRGLLVPAAPDPGGGALVAPEDVGVALARLHDDARLLVELSERARRFARSAELGWAAVGERWRAAVAGAAAVRSPALAAD